MAKDHTCPQNADNANEPIRPSFQMKPTIQKSIASEAIWTSSVRFRLHYHLGTVLEVYSEILLKRKNFKM
ncbi:hypothetical protein R6Q59_001873 [Mikania micrantha]